MIPKALPTQLSAENRIVINNRARVSIIMLGAEPVFQEVGQNRLEVGQVDQLELTRTAAVTHYRGNFC